MTFEDHTHDADRNERPRLLVVPHLYSEKIAVREIEFARRLTRDFCVSCLSWRDALHIDSPRALERHWKQACTALGSALARKRLRPLADGVTYVSVPVLQPILLQRVTGTVRAIEICQSFNRRTIECLAASLRVSHVLMAGGVFGLPRNNGVLRFFDVVDWFAEESFPPQVVKASHAQLKRATHGARAVFAASKPLCEKLRASCGVDAIPIPNGADLKSLRAVTPTETSELRRKLGLDGKFVIGYIGNHGTFTGVDFVLNVFRRAQKRIPNLALLIVGPAEPWRALLESALAEGVVWTGAIPPAEIAKYFTVLNVGVLAQGKTLGTEFAFQMKVVEYSACRKFVLATPLRVWEELRWPNVLLTPLNVDDWVGAIVSLQGREWQPSWDAEITKFDWRALADRMAAVMLRSDPRGNGQCVS